VGYGDECTTLNILKPINLCTVGEYVQYVNYISIKLLKEKEGEKGEERQREAQTLTKGGQPSFVCDCHIFITVKSCVLGNPVFNPGQSRMS
jgi:hypothetical protein